MKPINIRTKIRLHGAFAPLVMAVFFVLPINIVLLQKIYTVLSGIDGVKAGFAVSIPFFLVAAFNLLFTLLAVRRVMKPLFIFLILLSSLLTYSMYTYGIIFDKNMIMNIAETGYGEAASYLNFSALAWLFFLGVIPSLLLLKTEIIHFPLKRAALHKTVSVVSSLLVAGIIALFYFGDYASVIRNNPSLRKEVVPLYALDSAFTYVRKTYFREDIPYRQIGLDATQGSPPDAGRKKELVVLIIGETQRAMNYELNGYPRATNAYTKNLGVVSFQHTDSCGTATALSVPCLFSNLTRAKYSKDAAESQDNVLDIAQRAGVHVLWLDNDSGCKGVCKHVETADLRAEYKADPRCTDEGCRDDIFLTEFAKRFKTLPDKAGLVVLHIMGSHGPTYFRRYPEDHKAFAPDCHRSDIQNCSREELVNTYDNTILFSDYVMAGIIDILKENAASRDAALVFVSDHGESLGEKGLYLHGMPYAIAPEEQTHIPLISWMSGGFAAGRGIDPACVRRIAGRNAYSHDNMFHTVLGLLDVRTEAYKKDLDVFADCRTRRVTKTEHPRTRPPRTSG